MLPPQASELDADEREALLDADQEAELKSRRARRVKLARFAFLSLSACSLAFIVFSGGAGNHVNLGDLERKDSESASGVPDSVVLQGFQSQTRLNAIYHKRDGQLYTVNGKATYWSDAGYFMYWCGFTGFERWQITSEASLPGARDSKICNWNAYGPGGEFVLGSGWSEWDSSAKGAVERPDSTVSAYESMDSVTAAGFSSQNQLNAVYAKKDDPEHMVNGEPTYWSTAGFLLYWCPFTGFERWQIAQSSELQNARDKKMCNYNAFGPVGKAIPSSSGWSEWDTSTNAAVELKGAGVTSGATVAEDAEEEVNPGTSTVRPQADKNITIIFSHFLSQGQLNGNYVQHTDSDLLVNGRETYWSKSGGNFIYWCPFDGFARWQATSSSEFSDTRDKKMCNWNAYGPAGKDILDSNLSSGWTEWDSDAGAAVIVELAGVHSLAATDEISSGAWAQGVLEENPKHEMPATCIRQAMKHLVRGQPNCNNCWAIASSVLLEISLCAISESLCAKGKELYSETVAKSLCELPKFEGPNAFVSASYITSCATPAFVKSNGCDGGNPVKALRWMSEHGVPTGGSNTSLTTCVPYFLSSSSQDSQAPACPSSCTNPGYHASLQEDLIKAGALSKSWPTTSHESAIRFQKDWSAPFLIRFPVDAFFRDNYTGGIYSELKGPVLFYHVTLAIAAGPDFVMAVNSWGGSWGEILTYGKLDLTLPGCFRLHRSLISDYTIPGIEESNFHKVKTEKTPWHIDQWSLGVATLAGFANSSLNGDYTDSTFLVSDHSVYCAVKMTDEQRRTGSVDMAELNYSFPCLAYCNQWTRWLIIPAESVEKAREGLVCEKWDAYAQSPVIHANINLGNLLAYEEKRKAEGRESWVEYDSSRAKFVDQPAAAVVGVTLPLAR